MLQDVLDQIVVVDHDPRWPDQFEGERDKLSTMFGQGAIGIEHIGSTAVPGLCAKPIIDIMVGVPELKEGEAYIELLEPLGYINVPSDQDERYFFYKGMPRTHHVHITKFMGPEWARHIAFRDLLRNDAQVRDRYAQLKRESAIRFRDDRQAYVDSKSDFISSVADKALTGPDRPKAI